VQMHTALRLGQRVAARVRELNPTARLCFFGLYAPLHAEHLRSLGAAHVIGGEYEAELVSLAETLDAGATPAARPIVLERLKFALPLRDALPPLDRYAKLLIDGEERLAGQVEATRGCLHLCRHCPIPSVYDGRFFVVQAEVVLEDIRRQVAAGARHITFGDADFLNGPNHVMEIVRRMHAEHPALTFDVTTKIEHILEHRELFPELAALGCVFVISAVESLTPKVLEILDKGHTAADVDAAIDIVHAAGIPLRPSLLPFTPWTPYEDYQALLAWIERRGLIDQIDPVHLAIRLLIPPGSKLLELDEVRAIIGELDAVRLSYAWTHPDPRMDELQKQVMDAAAAGADAGDDPPVVFARIQRLAGLVPGAPPAGKRAPKLTEAWFCCAEPTEGQLDPL
jgi:radical SAM superfamily enzyme YgiQ (UPF0313 family)